MKNAVKNVFLTLPLKLGGSFVNELGLIRQRSSIGLSFQDPERYPWLKNAWRQHFNNLRVFKKLADDSGSQLLVVLIPTKDQVYFQSTSATVNLTYPNMRLTNFFDMEGIPYLDLLPLFRGYASSRDVDHIQNTERLYGKVDFHWNVRGNHLAGLLVSKYILDKRTIDLHDRETKSGFVEKLLSQF